MEHSFKRTLFRIMEKRWDVQSHEDKLTEGIPDLSYGINGGGGWIELKHIKNPKAVLKPKKFTPEQVNWLIRRGKKQVTCWIFVQVEDEYFIFHWPEARNIRMGMSYEWYKEKSIMHWIGKIDPDELACLLSRPLKFIDSTKS